MGALDLARWQFGITTVYHFLFVPLTIGLSALVAGMQTAWYRTGKAKYKAMTKFWGKLFLINFAMGVVTGIVQEFQFGMNWSDYSRFVGDIFGAPLAIEGLLAFFLESTFLGLWIFGWDRLSPKLHLASIWLAAIGTTLSAYFILAANSWMQHPVGYQINPATHRAEMHNFLAVMTNSTTLYGAFPHTITASFVTGGVFIVAISAWHLARKSHVDVYRASMKLGLATVLIASLGVAISGDIQARIMTKQEPMKMAAAEANWTTKTNVGFSILTIGSLNANQDKFSIRIPGLSSIMATGKPSGTVEGFTSLQNQYEQKYGPNRNYKPNVPVTYWSFRLMIGFGTLAALLAALGLWMFRRGRTPDSRTFYLAAVAAVVTPYLANSFGWVFTEMGRQPWTVFGVLTTDASVSPGVSAATVATSLIVFTLLYGALAVVELRLMFLYSKAGPQPEPAPRPVTGIPGTRPAGDDHAGTPAGDEPMTFAY